MSDETPKFTAYDGVPILPKDYQIAELIKANKGHCDRIYELAAELTDLRTQLAAAKVEVERLKDENDEFKRLLDGNGAKTRTVSAIEWYATAQYEHRQRVRISDQLAAAQKTIEDFQGREGRLREVLNQLDALDLECPGMPNARDSAILFAIATLTAAFPATDGGA